MHDSRIDTYEHIDHVRRFLYLVVADLIARGLEHDRSKLEEPERSVFDEYTPKLSASIYGSPEYQSFLAAMKPALDHHYAANRHHPEHFRWHCAVCDGAFSAEQAPESEWDSGERRRFCPRCVGVGSVIWEAELMDKPDRGIRGMTLVDLVEMICDWLGAVKRHKDGNIRRSIEINQLRFGYSDELKQIFLNTIDAIEGAARPAT